jgi:5-methyltetrahydropteroyltriglutamate--homocysteine methyltransferase
MPVLTTTIGSYPKPAYVPMPDWFRAQAMSLPAADAAEAAYRAAGEAEALFERATHEVVREQAQAGIDIPTDGEVRRENYIHYHCRHMDGIDFTRRRRKRMRAGQWTDEVPVITGPVRARERFLPRDWRVAQAATDRPVKLTVPGPLTIADTLYDEHYGDERRLCAELAAALNVEIRALAEAGCRWIQVDEPVFAREPEKALAFGIENLERCFQGVPEDVTRLTHICCGYPAGLDLEDYPKADPAAYFVLAGALDEAAIDGVSIEDAHRPNDLSLLERFARTQVILGVIAIARSRVEAVADIARRLGQALEHIEPRRLLAAPDCGLGMLDRPTIRAKLGNLAAAAQMVGATANAR